MGREGSSSCGRAFHLFVATVVLIAGAGLAGVGIWRNVRDVGGPFDLDYGEVENSNGAWRVALRVNTGLIVIGVFMACAAVAGIIATVGGCFGSIFRVIYILMAIVIFLGLATIAGVAFYLLSRRDENSLKDYVQDAWEVTVTENPTDICNIEKDYKCRGFNDNDCKSCTGKNQDNCTAESRAVCAPCGSSTFVSTGCFEKFTDSFRKYYIAIGSVFAALAVLVLFDMFVTCSL